LVGTTALYLLVLLIPISIAAAVLRYHLYNVDVLINRALVSASLTVVLAPAYFRVTSTEAIFRSPPKRSSPHLAVVASTLVIAALFNAECVLLSGRSSIDASTVGSTTQQRP
jgi:hypothetical protein